MNVQFVKNGMLSLVIVLVNQLGYSQELTVINQDYEQAKQASQLQNKLLLIDFYTTWCVPCKELDKVIFKDTAATREIAKNFVVLKYDAEKDSVHQLSLKYHINSYPTLLILNKDQLVTARAYGIPGEKEALKKNYFSFLEEGIDNHLQHKYVKGVSNKTHLAYPEFYKQYVYRTNTKNEKENLRNYWQNNTDYFGEVPFAILCYFTGATPEVNAFFLANRKKYEDLYGKLDVLFVVTMLINGQASKAIEEKNRALFNDAMRFAKENFEPKDTALYVQIMEERMLQAENRWQAATAMFEVRKQQMKLGPESINNFCWLVCQKCDDAAVLQKCVAWMKQVTDQTPIYSYLDTYARLLYKSGDKDQSYSNMEQAIAAGKLAKENTADSEKWLREVKK